MWACGQWFGTDVVDRIRKTVREDATVSRRALSRQVCEWLDWKDAKGDWREMSARVALKELERQGAIQLPEAKKVANFIPKAGRREKDKTCEPLAASVECSLKELGPLELVVVTAKNREQSRQWTRLMEQEHELGAAKLRGAQLRYLIQSPQHGYLGAASFSAASRALACRDKWIGWNAAAHRANLKQVISNSRFLIARGVNVPHLASHIMGRMLRRISQDWQDRYGYEPLLVETFVDPEKYEGTSYRAANWKHLGQTAGRKDGFANKKVSTGKKDVYVYALRKDARKLLRQEPEDGLKLRDKPVAASDWVEQEFATARVFDPRLRKRLYKVARSFAAQAQAAVPQSSDGVMAAAKGTYRFFKNPRITMDGLLKGHQESTLRRAAEHKVVLAVQDTTYLNYSSTAPDGAGPIGPGKDLGLLLHETMAFSVSGTPLGLMHVQCWARDPKQKGKRHKSGQLPIEEKESIVWLRSYRAVAEAQRLCPDTMFVSVGDRESDLYDLFAEAERTPEGPKLLVRAERSRNRKTLDGDETEALWERMQEQPVAGCRPLYIPKRNNSPGRIAKLEIRYEAVQLRPPVRSKHDPVHVWAVYAREIDYGPNVKSPIEWMLVTTVPVSSLGDALERMDWYTLRWGIESFHRILKSGCQVEERFINDVESLKKCLALDLVIAWRVHLLMKVSRETPDAPCTEFVEEDEWKVLYAFVYKEHPPPIAPSIRTVVRLIARIGGFLGSKRGSEPGMTTIWRGLTRLYSLVEGAAVARFITPHAPP